MLRNVEIRKESFFAGLSLRLQMGTRRLELPLFVSSSETKVRGEKACGQVAFLRRESFPLPPRVPARLISGEPLARIIRYRGEEAACLEIGSGRNRGNPLQLWLKEGLLGDGPTQVAVIGKEAHLETKVVVGNRSTFSLDINPGQGRLYANIQAIR